MTFERWDPERFKFGRIPDPATLARVYSFNKAVTSIHPLLRSQGVAVIAIGYEPKLSIHPVAILRMDGSLAPIPQRGLKESTRPDFKYEIEPDRPIRTARDPVDLAERWVRAHADWAV